MEEQDMPNTIYLVGDKVLVTCSDEGYNGQQGTVLAVFPSGRCQVAVGPIAILNVPPEGIRLQCECGSTDLHGPTHDYYGVCCVDCGNELRKDVNDDKRI